MLIALRKLRIKPQNTNIYKRLRKGMITQLEAILSKILEIIIVLCNLIINNFSLFNFLMIFIVENFHNNLNKIKEGAPAAPPLFNR
jgi:hypothetical protein